MKNLLIPLANKILISAATFLFIIFIFDFSAKASTFTSAASGNWNSTSSWTFSGSDGDGIPDANDIVTIGSGHTITITAPAECTSLTFLADASACSVIISGSNLLTVSGEIAINNDNDDTHKLLAVNSGTLNAGSIDINGGNGQKVSELSISTGTINVTGNFTDGNSGNSLLTFTGSGIINAGGGGANSFGNFNFTPSTSTVNYNSTGAQTVR